MAALSLSCRSEGDLTVLGSMSIDWIFDRVKSTGLTFVKGLLIHHKSIPFLGFYISARVPLGVRLLSAVSLPIGMWAIGPYPEPADKVSKVKMCHLSERFN